MTILGDISFLISMLHIIILFLLLFVPRYSWRTTFIATFFGWTGILGVNALIMARFGTSIIMNVAFLTCTIPSMVLFFVLSQYRDGRFFFLFCLSDTMSFWLMQITNLIDRLAGNSNLLMLISRLILFPVVEYLIWRYLRPPFLALQHKLPRGWWLFAAIGLIYYLLVMFTAIPAGAPLPDTKGFVTACLVMILMPLTYATVLVSLWRQMETYEHAHQLEWQRRNYEDIRKQMEIDRIYRHDMRHHLAVLDSMLSQGDIAQAHQYMQGLAGGLESQSKRVSCANPAVNAVLTAYSEQARRAGCRVILHTLLPEALPFEETDLCVLLANPFENAIRACRQLPEEQRVIRLSAELTENERLTVFMENPCIKPVEFALDGLPVRHTADVEHGLGLRSVQKLTEKYGGLFRCHCENGKFILQAMLISPSVRTNPPARPSLWHPTTFILIFLAFLILLNCVPSLADILERIPLLKHFIYLVDLRTYPFYWL